MTIKNLISVLLLGTAVFAAAAPQQFKAAINRLGVAVQPAAPSVPVAQPRSDLVALANQVSPLFATNKDKAKAFEGFFAALAVEVRDNPNITTTTQIALLQDRAGKRWSSLLALPPGGSGTALKAAVDALMKQAIGTLQQVELSPEQRTGAVDGFLALEWAVCNAASL